MRADRLLSLLMLLQSRGQMTAQALAAELEVSVRTIYRDIDALGASGVPVYGVSGPEGGYALLESYRTNLTGLTENEVRALFMLSVPSSMDALGVTQEMKAALRKLAAALPSAQRGDELLVRQRFYLDSTWWHRGQSAVPHLRAIQQATWEDRQIRLSYHPPYATRIESVVDPYGVVVKAGVWYLVCAKQGRVCTQRISSLLEVQPLEAHFERPADFDLVAYWKAWCAEVEQRRTLYPVTLRVSPDFIPLLPSYFSESVQRQLEEAGPPDAAGWVRLTLSFDSLESARDRLLNFGRAVEVLEPRALRWSLADIARQIVDLYDDALV